MWDKHLGKNGNGLKAFLPEQHLPMVSGGPYTITKYQEKGTTVFRPNPYFYGPKSTAAAVTLTYYTNSTSMVADLTAGNLDFVDAVPYTAGSALKQPDRASSSTSRPGDEVTNLGFNSNPLEAEEPRAPEPDGEGGARVRDPAAADRERRLPRLRASVGEHHVGVVGARRAGSTPP